MTALAINLVLVTGMIFAFVWLLVRTRETRQVADANETKVRWGRYFLPFCFFVLGIVDVVLGIRYAVTGEVGRSRGSVTLWWQAVAIGILLVAATVGAMWVSRREPRSDGRRGGER